MSSATLSGLGLTLMSFNMFTILLLFPISQIFNFYSMLVVFLRWFIWESVQVRCLKLHDIGFKVMCGSSGEKYVILQARWKRMAPEN